jgi:hypothetical protein
VLQVATYHAPGAAFASFAVHRDDIRGIGLQPRMRILAEPDALAHQWRVVVVERDVRHAALEVCVVVVAL